MALIYAFNLLDPIRLTVVDLGRHIANGRELLSGNTQVLFQNHYSYSMPEQKFINHHWFFGVIVYLLDQLIGLAGPQLFNIFILLVVLFFLLKMMEDVSSPLISSLLGLIAVIFLSMRTEIRPESIGLLFTAHTLWQLKKIQKNDFLSPKIMTLLLIQQLVWANTHISFIFGIFLIGLAWSCAAILKSPHVSFSLGKKLGWLLVMVIIVSLINPNFFRGFLEPFNILIDYGYSIVENQTLLFLWKAINHSGFIWFTVYSLMFIPLYLMNFRELDWFEKTLSLTGLFLGYQALRNVPLMIVFTIPTLAKLFNIQYEKIRKKISFDFPPKLMKIFLGQLYGLFLLLTFAGIINPSINFSNRKLGPVVEEARAASFIKESSKQGPIFNNYDLGSYLIYHLHPKHKVFVDNRPEAYSSSFFQNTYIPMQQDSEIWTEVANQYDFKLVVFGARDITPWAKQFITHMIDNPDWKKIYEDQYIIIWEKDDDFDV